MLRIEYRITLLEGWRSETLAARVADEWDVVVVEPSDAVMFQHDYFDLLSGEDVETVAANTYGVMEYLNVFRLDEFVEFRLRASPGSTAEPQTAQWRRR